MKTRYAGAVIVVTFLALGAFHVSAQQQQREVPVVHKKSKHHDMYVSATRDGFRYLRFGSNTVPVGAIKLDEPGFLRVPSTRTMVASLAFPELEPRNVLYFGMRAGSIPMFLKHHFRSVNVTVVEQDKELIELAKEHLDFKADAGVKAAADAPRNFLRKNKDKFDMVFLDLYEAEGLPYLLTTQEFLRQVKEAMAPGGYMITRLGDPKTNRGRDSMLKTYQQEFKEMYLFTVPGTGEEVVIAATSEGQVTREAAMRRAGDIVKLTPFSFDLSATVDSQYQYATKMRFEGRVLRDGQAPLTPQPVQ